MLDIDRLLCFTLKGKFAHFRKFYTNSSSLSYLIPPRTVLAGMIASVLKISRDHYYEELGPEKIGLSVAIPLNCPLNRQMQSMNYLHNKYYNLIAKGKGAVQHSQCKLELVTGENGLPVKYSVWVGFQKINETMSIFEKKLTENNLGYGVYLGQRQFIGYIEDIKRYTDDQFEIHESSKFLDSVCALENILELSAADNIEIQKERMVSDFRHHQNGREMSGTQSVVFEKFGNRLSGLFKNCIKVEDRFISFY